MAEKTKAIVVKVTPEQHAKIRAKAERKSTNVSAMLRRTLLRWADEP